MIDEATNEDFLDHEMADPVEEIAPPCQVNPIMEYTLRKNAQQLDMSLTCLHHMESSGHFDIPPGPCVIDITASTNTEEVGNDHHLEDEWKHAYNEWKNKWKCDQQDSVSKAPAKMYFDAAIQPCISGNNGDPCVLTSDQHQPSVSVWPSGKYKNEPQDRNLLAQQIAEKFTLNEGQRQAFMIITEHSKNHISPPLHIFLGGPGGLARVKSLMPLESSLLNLDRLITSISQCTWASQPATLEETLFILCWDLDITGRDLNKTMTIVILFICGMVLTI